MRNRLLALFVCLLGTFLLAGTADAQRQIPINIESTPPGATVYLDAPTQPIGTTPIRNVRVAAGSHTLIFRAENHEEARLPVNVRRWRETFRAVLNPLATIVVSAGNEGANSAAVRIDGQPVGNVPFRGTAQPGRHLIQVGREGFVTFSQWVELAGGQVLTLPVMLERETPATGTLLVAGDVSGAPIFIDGEPRGVTPTVIENVPAGEHQLEIRPEGMEVFRQTVRVMAGERLNVNPTMRPAPAATGSLRVMANVPGAQISLDGEPIGNAPVTRGDVPPGEHIVEATAEGYQTAQQSVTVESGQQRIVSLSLTADQRPPGRILVDTNAPNAVITVDGEERGTAPVVIEDANAGTHTISVSAQGYESFRTTCQTAPGRNCEVNAVLTGQGTPVRVAIQPGIRGAQLYVDDELMGPIPYEGNIPAGEHRMEVRAPGFQTHVQQVNLQVSSTPRSFDVTLMREGEMTEEERVFRQEELARLRTGATSHSAAALPPDLALLDISVGWPYLAELRLGVGILDVLEGGFAIRTFGRIFEFEGRAKVGVRPVSQVSVGAQVRVGGGIGPSRDALEAETNLMPSAEGHDVNTVFFSGEVMGSLHFAEAGAFTLWLGFDTYSDQYDWWGENSDCLIRSDAVSAPASGFSGGTPEARQASAEDIVANEMVLPLTDESDGCDPETRVVPEAGMEEDTGALRDGRQSQARVRLGGSLELVLSRSANIWAILEGVLAGESRDLYGDILGLGGDTELYFRLGYTHKF